jgi:hypothetical protein
LLGILTECHFNAVCIEARHAHRILSSRPNKTERNDARGIAEMMRLGHLRAWGVKLAKRVGSNKACVPVARKARHHHALHVARGH